MISILASLFFEHSVYWNFYDDVIIMTLRVHRMLSVSAVCPFFHHLPSVKRLCELRVPEKWMRSLQQWNLFKCQTATFYFSTYCSNLFEHYIELLIHAGQTVWKMRLLRSLDQLLKQHIGQVFFHQQHFLVHKQTSYTKHVLLVL